MSGGEPSSIKQILICDTETPVLSLICVKLASVTFELRCVISLHATKLLRGYSVYQALYRKYRPLVFNDVVGQEHIVNTIKNQIVNNKISHAYMFTGTRGTGKTTCAKILARAVNCENPVNGDPCNECFACKGILNGSLLDVFEIDAASNNGVDNIRELREDVMFTPASAKYKVYIIDEVHMLSNQAFNALLKTLEEPPSHIIFVFATTEIHKVPQTILSRCQRFDFKRITVDDIQNRLKYVASQEGIKLDDAAADMISRLADGAMRDALSIMDRCITSSEEITQATVEHTVGLCSYDLIFSALKAIADDDTDSMLRIYNDCRKNSKDAVSFFSELCSYFRDLIIIKLSKNYSEFLNYNSDKLDKLKDLSSSFDVEKIVRSVGILQNGIYDISKFKDKHIMAEMTIIKLTNPNVGGDYDDLNARLSRLEVLGVSAPVPAKKAPEVKHEKIAEVPEKKKFVTETSLPSCDFWPKMIDIVFALGGNSVAAIMKTVSATIEGNSLVIGCTKSDLAYSILSTPDNLALIKNAAQRATGELYSVKFSEKAVVNDSKDDAFSEFLNNANDILYKE